MAAEQQVKLSRLNPGLRNTITLRKWASSVGRRRGEENVELFLFFLHRGGEMSRGVSLVDQ
jgi:hypothetical protein